MLNDNWKLQPFKISLMKILTAWINGWQTCTYITLFGETYKTEHNCTKFPIQKYNPIRIDYLFLKVYACLLIKYWKFSIFNYKVIQSLDQFILHCFWIAAISVFSWLFYCPNVVFLPNHTETENLRSKNALVLAIYS